MSEKKKNGVMGNNVFTVEQKERSVLIWPIKLRYNSWLLADNEIDHHLEISESRQILVASGIKLASEKYEVMKQT